MLNLKLFLCFVPIFGCINTRTSETENRQITNETVHLILGQFAHHGDAYYEDQIVQKLKSLEKDANDFESQNELAVAYLKLGRYNEAEGQFLLIEEDHPGLYKTHANLGVLYKKTGNYSKAVEHTKKALEIKPEGHLSLGNYYLHMLRWKQKISKRGESKPYREPTENFLGIAYKDGPEKTALAGITKKLYMTTLIKSDASFHDGLLVLGDILFFEKDYQLAIRAYTRAQILEHPAQKVVSSRIRLVHKVWKNKLALQSGYILESDGKVARKIREENKRASQWLSNFKLKEATLLASGKTVNFSFVKKALENDGASQPTVFDLGLIRGRVATSFFDYMVYAVGILGGVLLALLLTWGFRKRNLVLQMVSGA